MLQELFAVGTSANLPIIQSDKSGNRLVISLRDGTIHKLTRLGQIFDKVGFVSLSRDLVSISVGCNEIITIVLSDWSVLMCTWNDLFISTDGHSRKRKLNSNDETDIFFSLLEDIPSSHSSSSSGTVFTNITSATPTDHTLISCKIIPGALIGFTIASNDANQINLIIWQQLSATNYSSTPIAIVSHKHNRKGRDIDARAESSLIACLLVTCESESSNQDCVVGLNDVLYAYLFGHGNLLSGSVMVLYGGECGCVLVVSLTRPSAAHSNQHPQIVCSLDQPIVSIHSSNIGSNTSAHNVLLFVGSLGKLILFVADQHNVKHYDLLLSSPVLSTLIVQGVGLLYSSLDGVRKVCLSDSCMKTDPDNEMIQILRSFETPVIVVNTPMLLSCFITDYSTIIGVTLDGRIVMVKLRLDESPSTPTYPNELSESIKSSLISIQSSSNELAKVQSDVKCIDEALIALNETMSLFRKLSTKDISPFTVYPEIAYDQIAPYQYTPHLEVFLAYRGSRTLREGLSLVVDVCFDIYKELESFVKPKLSHSEVGTSFRQVFPLGGLHNGGDLRVRLSLPCNYFCMGSVLRVSFWCSFSPVITSELVQSMMSKDDVAMVLFKQLELSSLNYLHPLKSIGVNHAHKMASFDISVNTLSAIANTIPVSMTERQLSPKLLSCLISESSAFREKAENSTSVVSDFRGRGLELGVACSTEIMTIKLCGRDQYTLSVSSPTLETSLVICYEIVQRLREKFCAVLQSEDRGVKLQTVLQQCVDDRLCQKQEALKAYFQRQTL